MIVFLIYSIFSSASSQFVGFQGKLYDSSGLPMNSSAVVIEAKVLSPDGLCLLRGENHTLDMSESDGFFSIPLGSGTLLPHSPQLSIATVFSNRSTLSDSQMNCSGNSYEPAPHDHRLIRVSVNGETLTPDFVVGGVPYSLEAKNAQLIDGKSYPEILNYTNTNLAGKPLPDFDATPLNIGDTLRWDGGQWSTFQAAPADLPTNSVTIDDLSFASSEGINIPKLSSAPTHPTAGQTFYNTTLNQLMVYDGTSWNSGTSGWKTTGMDISYSTGKVGVGTTTPQAKVDIAGSIKIGNEGIACSLATEGTIRYNSTSKRMEYCNSSNWQQFSLGVKSSVSLSSPSAPIVSSGSVDYTITYGAGTDPPTITLSATNVNLTGPGSSGCSKAVSGSGLTRTVTIDNCTGTGSVAVSIDPNTAQSTTGNAADAAGPSETFIADNTGPSAPASLTLGPIPTNLTSSPTLDYTSGVDTGGSTTAGHEVRIIRSTDSALIADWANHASGNAVTGLSLTSTTEYTAEVRAIDGVGNRGTSTSSNWTTVGTCAGGSFTFGSTHWCGNPFHVSSGRTIPNDLPVGTQQQFTCGYFAHCHPTNPATSYPVITVECQADGQWHKISGSTCQKSGGAFIQGW